MDSNDEVGCVASNRDFGSRPTAQVRRDKALVVRWNLQSRGHMLPRFRRLHGCQLPPPLADRDPMKISFLPLAASFLTFSAFGSLAQDASPASAMQQAASGFLASLDAEHKAKASFAFDADARENFKFTPQVRTGLPLKEMTDAQRAAAMKLLDSALSDRGKLKVTQIMTLEGVLREMEKNPTFRDPEKYFVSIFGTPGDEKGWGWKFEGHHLSLNYTVVKGRELSVTPSFYGSNPGEVIEGEHKGLNVLGTEENLAHVLLNVLLEGGKKEVIFSEKPPKEILSAESRKATALEPVGLLAGEMTETQKKALLSLIAEFTNRHRKHIADVDMNKIEKAGIDKIRFGWAGGSKPEDAWYFRIQGPTFLMEAANVQNNANHIHATWRDFEGDFGRDLLAEHYNGHEK